MDYTKTYSTYSGFAQALQNMVRKWRIRGGIVPPLNVFQGSSSSVRHRPELCPDAPMRVSPRNTSKAVWVSRRKLLSFGKAYKKSHAPRCPPARGCEKRFPKSCPSGIVVCFEFVSVSMSSYSKTWASLYFRLKVTIDISCHVP